MQHCLRTTKYHYFVFQLSMAHPLHLQCPFYVTDRCTATCTWLPHTQVC